MKQPGIILFALLLLASMASSQTTPRWKTLPDIPPLPQADESGLAAINGIRLYYAVFNKAGKDPVILLHGGFASSE